MPVQYTGLVQEHHAVRQQAGLFDVSHMGQLELRGEHAGALIDWLVTNDVKKLAVGKALYTVCCNEQGMILDDLIVYRVDEHTYRIVCNASNHSKISAHFREAAQGHCEFHDFQSSRGLIALQGPLAAQVLQTLQGASEVGALPSFGCQPLRVLGEPVFVARTGYTGEDGFELSCDARVAPELWRALLQAGRQSGVQAAGLGARDTLRLEACLALYGNEIDETTHPLQAKLGWVVKMQKGDFVGRAALQTLAAAPMPRVLVGLEMVERGIARHGYPVVDPSNEQVGVVTSGSPSPTLQKNIALAYVPHTHREVGSTVHVRIRDKQVRASVVATPFYKRK
jgi:aminomethyltransferase